jgi:hypothetical protein
MVSQPCVAGELEPKTWWLKQFGWVPQATYNPNHAFLCPKHDSSSNLGSLWPRRQGWKNLRPTLSMFGLLFGPKLRINARTLTSEY